MIDFEELKKQFKKEVDVAGQSGYSVVPYYIDSGNMVLNWILSENFFGGYPAGRIVEIFGPPGVGKSILGTLFLVQCQNANGIAMLDDVEITYDKAFGEILGINNEKLLLVTRKEKEKDEDGEDIVVTVVGSKTVEQVRRKIIKLCKTVGVTKDNNTPFGYLVDSIGLLTTEQETEKNDKRDMSKAYQLNKLMRLCHDECQVAGITIVLLNHVYTKTDGYIQKDVSSGGYGVKFASSIRISIKRKAIKKILKNKVEFEIGSTLTIKCEKNNVAPSGRKASFDILHNKPINRYAGLMDLLLHLDMLEKVPKSQKLKFTTVEDTVEFQRLKFLTEGVKLIEERPELLKINYYDETE